MQIRAGTRLVGIDRAADGDTGADVGRCLGLVVDDERLGATVAPAHGDDDAALAGFVDGKATVHPIGLVVGLLDRAADVAAIDLDLAARPVLGLIAVHGRAKLVRQDKGRLVLHAEIAAELQGADALHGYDDTCTIGASDGRANRLGSQSTRDCARRDGAAERDLPAVQRTAASDGGDGG